MPANYSERLRELAGIRENDEEAALDAKQAREAQWKSKLRSIVMGLGMQLDDAQIDIEVDVDNRVVQVVIKDAYSIPLSALAKLLDHKNVKSDVSVTARQDGTLFLEFDV